MGSIEGQTSPKEGEFHDGTLRLVSAHPDAMAKTLHLDSQERVAEQWRFLERHPDACGVVTRRMEVIYLNAAARMLVPRGWFGCRCWKAFSSANPACVRCCPVIRAIAASFGICYCEETIFRPDQSPLLLGAAVIPVPSAAGDGPVLLLLRPNPEGPSAKTIRQDLLDEAGRLHDRCSEWKPPANAADMPAG